MLPENCPGDTEAGGDRQTNFAQTDETDGFWTNCRFITKPGGIQR